MSDRTLSANLLYLYCRADQLCRDLQLVAGTAMDWQDGAPITARLTYSIMVEIGTLAFVLRERR